MKKLLLLSLFIASPLLPAQKVWDHCKKLAGQHPKTAMIAGALTSTVFVWQLVRNRNAGSNAPGAGAAINDDRELQPILRTSNLGPAELESLVISFVAAMKSTTPIATARDIIKLLEKNTSHNCTGIIIEYLGSGIEIDAQPHAMQMVNDIENNEPDPTHFLIPREDGRGREFLMCEIPSLKFCINTLSFIDDITLQVQFGKDCYLRYTIDGDNNCILDQSNSFPIGDLRKRNWLCSRPCAAIGVSQTAYSNKHEAEIIMEDSLRASTRFKIFSKTDHMLEQAYKFLKSPVQQNQGEGTAQEGPQSLDPLQPNPVDSDYELGLLSLTNSAASAVTTSPRVVQSAGPGPDRSHAALGAGARASNISRHAAASSAFHEESTEYKVEL